MEVLKDYPKEFAKLFRPSFNYLLRINMKFLAKDEGFVRKYWPHSYIMPCLLMNYVTLSWNLAKTVARGEIFEIAYLVPPFLVSTQGILKAIVLAPKIELLSTIIEELGKLWRTTGLTKNQMKTRTTLLRRMNLCNGLLVGLFAESTWKGITPLPVILPPSSNAKTSATFPEKLQNTKINHRISLGEERSVVVVTYWIGIFGSGQYLLTPLAETLVRRLLLKQEFGLLFPLQCSYPFDPTASWAVYLATYGFQCYGMLIGVAIYCGAELLMITLCALIGVEFTLLSEDMNRALQCDRSWVNEGENDDTTDDNDDNNEGLSIKEVIERHQRLCTLSKQLDEAFNQMVFLNLLFVGLITCFFTYSAQFSRGPTYKINNYVAVISSLLYSLYMCYYGDLLTTASFRIGNMAYESLWFENDTQYQKIILIIIMRSQKPCCLTSMKYAAVSMNMFTKVISTTWSYLSLMNQVYYEN